MKTINELISLKGKCALITGAGGKIGYEIALTIAELGGDLILVDRPGTNYDKLQIAIKAFGDRSVKLVDTDLEDEDARSELITNLLNDKAPLNILINNAGFVGTSDLKGWVTDIQNQSIETWRRAVEVNLTAAFDLSKGLIPKIKESGDGSIINISSIYGFVAPDYSLYEDTQMGNPAAYAASKGGLIQLSRWMATTLAPDIRVNTISPGGVFRNQPAKFVKRYKMKTPLARMATEEDFKGAIIYLASNLSSYVTGHNLIVDGGWSSW
jgi:NAD(P)-dependent dehydrogenase (short-subunit alcohol dehydrogenase family)